ncbi:MAG: elongation factor Ts [Clostridia bacterium]|nr:elongation factor Ts [Clostridia bacterium]MBR3552580.1 elongation factor Ts [Clostridia bacterium]
MAAFTAKDVQALREKTGVGMMECKKALVEAEGDMDKAVEILKERGLATQQKKSSRVAAEGVVVAYNDKENKVGVLVEVNCETDFVAKNPDFVALANRIAKTVAEKNPADVDALLKETIADGTETVEEAVQELFLAIRENMKVRRFARVEGVVETYIHAGGAVGVMVRFETDDATAAKDEFVAMGKNIAMQVAAMSPEYLSESDITADELAKMKTITIESALNKPDSLPKPILKKVFDKVLSEKLWSDEDASAYEEQKNNKFLFNFLSKEGVAKLAEVAVSLKDLFVNDVIFGKAVDGRINKQIKEICLLNQVFVRSDLFDGNVSGYVADVAKKLGADIKVTGFTRFQRGEGIEKKADNFAAEIASMVK